MSPQEPGERVFDRYLQGDSALSKIYKSATSEAPPPDLDAAILAKARYAAEAHALMRRRQMLQRWMIPASLAAALLLTVGLVTFVSEHGGMPLAPKRTSEQREASQLPGRELPLPRQEEVTRQPRSGSANEPIAGKDTEALRSDVASPASGERQATQPAASAPPQRTLIKVKEEAEQLQPLSDKTGETGQPMPGQSTGETDLPPQEWLKHIAELRKQGKLREAQASLEDFRRRYPDYPVETILK